MAGRSGAPPPPPGTRKVGELSLGVTVVELDEADRRAEHQAQERALAKAKGNRTLAARILGVSRRTLYNKLAQHVIVRDAGDARSTPSLVGWRGGRLAGVGCDSQAMYPSDMLQATDRGARVVRPSLRARGLLACGMLMLATASACSGGSKGATSPDGSIGVSHGSDTEGDAAGALPRYYTIEVRSDGLWLDGQLVAADRVPQLLADAAGDTRNQGAAVILYTGEPPAGVVLDQIARAGFTHVVVSGLSANSFAGAGVPMQANEAMAARSVSVNDGAVAEPAKEEDDAESKLDGERASVSDVEVKHYGLHIGGGPNTDEARDRYLKPLARQFGKLQECHLLAKDRTIQASFGVDLLIGSKGGRPKIQDFRTRLKGKDFQMCVIGALGEVKFPTPERATVVSYSVLFKPTR